MANRERLLASNAMRYQRRNLFARRYEAVDLLSLRSTTVPSLRARVCRAWPLALLLSLAAVTIAAVVIVRDSITDHATDLRDELMEAMVTSSQVISETIHDVLLNTTETLEESFAQ